MRLWIVAILVLFSSSLGFCAENSLVPTTFVKTEIELGQVFKASPVIYSLLLFLSVASLSIWIHSLLSFRKNRLMPSPFVKKLKITLLEKDFEEALRFCQSEKHLFSSLLSPPIQLRKHGMQLMIDSLKEEGKRASHSFWQKLSLLNDIAVIAPMLGLLGTVLGMFYAFYDINRSIESMASLFDGLGIAVGTTVMGLIVALFSMILSTTLKHRLIKTFSMVENEALDLAHLIEEKPVEVKIKKSLKKETVS